MWHTKPETWHGITQTRIVLIPHFFIEYKIHIFWYIGSLTCEYFQWNITAKIPVDECVKYIIYENQMTP